MGSTHIPVLFDEVAESLIRPEYRLVVDATIGGGGQTYRILSKYPNLRVVGMDIDEIALAHARERLVPFQDRVTLKRGNFSELKQVLGDEGISAVDAILLDLGVSSYQLEGDRGFSFKDEQELDMRMDQRQNMTAYHVVNTYTYEELRRVIAEFGEEYKASQIARAIVDERRKAPIETARALGTLIARTTRRHGKKRGLVYPVREAVKKIRSLSKRNRIALLFGREDRGLTNEETTACSFMIRIPASPVNPSYNLAQAVLLIAYELSYGDHSDAPLPAIVSNDEFSSLFERTREIMKMAGYKAKGIRHSEEDIMTDLRRLLARIGTTKREARMLHGIISQIQESLTKKIDRK
jgi:16S rRNA (cytosine1402-N4)-methyltransferase